MEFITRPIALVRGCRTLLKLLRGRPDRVRTAGPRRPGWEAGGAGQGPAGSPPMLLLGLLAGQLVDLGGPIRMGDGGGQLQLLPAVDTQVA